MQNPRLSDAAPPTYTHRRRRRALLSLLARLASPLREACLSQTLALLSPRAGPYCLSSQIAIQNVLFWVKQTDLPCTRRMADMSAPSLLKRLGNRIYSVSLRRRTASSSRGPVFSRHRTLAEPPPSAESKWQTAFPPPSSGCHHFHKAPSSDGASFFAPIRECGRIVAGRQVPVCVARVH